MAGYQFVDIYPDAAIAPTGPGSPGSAPATNEEYPGLPVGAVPDSFDVTVTTATTTAVWTPPADRRVVVESVFISTDVAGRIAVVDDQDIQGRRIAVLYAAANGGASPNLVPAPYEAQSMGTPIRVVTAAAGNIFVRVTGYTKPA